jgi:integrase
VRSEGHARTVSLRLEKYLFPVLGSRPIADIVAPELLALLRDIEAGGAIETAHRVKQIAGAIFRFGIATGRCVHDISGDLKGALVPKSVMHHSSLTAPKDIAVLMRGIDVYRGSPVVKTALYFSAYSMLRPGEVRRLEWAEVDFDGMEIRIPAEKMKKRRLHIVPMARQVVEILERLRPLTGSGKYVFPSMRTPDGSRPMSENTIRVALRAMGFSNEEMTAHGFRSMSSTNLNEQGWDGDLVELQLAHQEENKVRAAYNYAERLPERRKMMQAWADWLDSLMSDTPQQAPRSS